MRSLIPLVLLGTVLGFSSAAWADTSGSAADRTAINKLFAAGCAGFIAKNIDETMSPYSQQLYVFDIAPPQHGSYQSLRASNAGLMAAMTTKPTCSYREMFIKVYGDNAYAHYILPFSATLKSGQMIDIEGRGTDILEKTNGKWLIVHEHFSVPASPLTGQAELKPAS